MQLITLRELCKALNLTRRTIQCYEQAGLMKPVARNKYGYLLYDQESVERAARIKFLQGLGFKHKEIYEIIDAPDEILLDALENKMKELEGEMERIAELLKETELLINSLNSMRKKKGGNL